MVRYEVNLLRVNLRLLLPFPFPFYPNSWFRIIFSTTHRNGLQRGRRAIAPWRRSPAGSSSYMNILVLLQLEESKPVLCSLYLIVLRLGITCAFFFLTKLALFSYRMIALTVPWCFLLPGNVWCGLLVFLRMSWQLKLLHLSISSCCHWSLSNWLWNVCLYFDVLNLNPPFDELFEQERQLSIWQTDDKG